MLAASLPRCGVRLRGPPEGRRERSRRPATVSGDSSGYESSGGYETDEGVVTEGLVLSSFLEQYGLLFPTTSFTNKGLQRAVRVWARHVGASGELVTLQKVDALPREPVAWRKFTGAKWEAAATELAFPLDRQRCVRLRQLVQGRTSHLHAVWGASRGPLAAAQQQQEAPDGTPFFLLFMPGANRFLTLEQLRAALAASPASAAAAGASKQPPLPVWAAVQSSLLTLFADNAEAAAHCAQALGCSPEALAAHPLFASAAPTPSRAPAAAAVSDAAAAPTRTRLTDPVAGKKTTKAAAVQPEVVALPPPVEEAAPLFLSAGLSGLQLLQERGVSWAFLSPTEKSRMISAQASAKRMDTGGSQTVPWARADWERCAEQLGILFLEAGTWSAPLRSLAPGWNAAWAPAQRSVAFWVSGPGPNGTLFVTLPELRKMAELAVYRGTRLRPSWSAVLASLRQAARSCPPLQAALRVQMRNMAEAAERAGEEWVEEPAELAGEEELVEHMAAGGALQGGQGGAGRAASQLSASSAVQADWVWSSPPAAAPAGALVGKSPEDLYLGLGLGFAFMRLGAAEIRRIQRAAQDQAQARTADPGDTGPWGVGREAPLPEWLPEGRHSQPLAGLGRGVTAAWGAGRVYIYAPAPLDRFMQTTELRAGLFDASLRPVGLPTDTPWSAWSGARQALSLAAASNPYLRAALRADPVFPADALPEGEGAGEEWPEEDDWEDDDDLLDNDPIFAATQVAVDEEVNFAPGGLKLPKAKLLKQPWREPGYVDETFQRLQAERLSRPTEARPWPQLPELEAHGVVLTDEAFAVFSLHSCNIFVRKTEEGLLDLRDAYGVDKEGVLDGISEQWGYSDRWWFAGDDVPDELEPSDYQVVEWTRRPTLSGSRGDRRLGETPFMIDWAEEDQRLYFVRCYGDNVWDHTQKQLDFSTVIAADDASGMFIPMPVVGLLRPRRQLVAAGAGEAEVVGEEEMEETWDLPHDAHLIFNWDHVYVATPDQMEPVEDLVYAFLLKHRYKLQPDGSMKGTPLRLDLPPEVAASLAAEKEREEREARAAVFQPLSQAELEARRAEAEEARMALEQEERETLDDSSDIPEVDQADPAE